ncbi:hypothetical protein C0Q70_10246 [Pomacea canaliculata]|uniref:Sodium/calcium exchanger membrane region domain-containing protein n=1 Tax=Pomacea canaliculata TaxID=400727 RepID=A0A2T7PC29_POMCA|nr:hypothetical protein C0Q70_10246 [Pomacea canaliculata]
MESSVNTWVTGIVGEVQGSGGCEVSKIPESANILLTGLNKHLVSGEQVMSAVGQATGGSSHPCVAAGSGRSPRSVDPRACPQGVCFKSRESRPATPRAARARRDTGLVATARVLGGKREHSFLKISVGLSWEDDSGNCTPRAVNNFPENFFSLELTKDGAVVLHILIAFYLFAALAIICDDYFVPSLEQICKDLHLKEDVAGATFMAAGSSAPELCTSIVGLFIARSDVGVGTIVGSAVFNILFIIGICGLFAGMVVQLTWYPLVRDTLFYLASVVALGPVHRGLENPLVYEALIMLLMYCVYIVIMYFNAGMERFFIALWERLWSGRKPADEEVDDVEARQPLLKSQDKTGSQPLLQSDNVSSGDDVIGRPNKVDSDVSIRSDKVSDDHVSSEGRQLPSRSDEASVWEIPEPFLVRVLWVAMVPMKGLFYLTVPDCRQERMRRLYPVTFVMSVVWIAASSYVLVWMITIAGREEGGDLGAGRWEEGRGRDPPPGPLFF